MTDEEKREKVRVQKAAWRKANPGKVRVISARFYAKNREKVAEWGKARSKANPERERARQAAWRKANPDKAHARAARYRAKNRAKIAAQKAQYAKDHPDKIRERHTAWVKANPEKQRAIRYSAALRESTIRKNLLQHTSLAERTFLLSSRGKPLLNAMIARRQLITRSNQIRKISP